MLVLTGSLSACLLRRDGGHTACKLTFILGDGKRNLRAVGTIVPARPFLFPAKCRDAWCRDEYLPQTNHAPRVKSLVG
jgi:hypothetical protein